MHMFIKCLYNDIHLNIMSLDLRNFYQRSDKRRRQKLQECFKSSSCIFRCLCLPILFKYKLIAREKVTFSIKKENIISIISKQRKVCMTTLHYSLLPFRTHHMALIHHQCGCKCVAYLTVISMTLFCAKTVKFCDQLQESYILLEADAIHYTWHCGSASGYLILIRGAPH